MTRQKELVQAAREEYPEWEEAQCHFIDGAHYADSHPHWISVIDELPKDGQHTATINKVGFQAVRYYKGGKWFSSYGNEYGDITHWLPLPQAPKKGGKE